MEGIVVLIVLVILGLGLNYLNSLQGEFQKKAICDIHKWSYNPVNQKLECTECNFKAESNRDE